jgi:endonuclease-3
LTKKKKLHKTNQAILQILEEHYGNTSTALKFGTRFQLLVSTILSAQSTDVQVNKITKALFKECPDPKSFLKLSLTDLEKRIRKIGLYRNKAKSIMGACKMIVEDFNGRVPDTREGLMKLPGVGRKTANVVLSVGFSQNAFAVDTHVFRVANRLGLTNSKNPLESEMQLMEVVPEGKWRHAHHWLIWHGRKICKAQKPLCETCPLKAFCQYYKKRGNSITKKR